LHSPDDEKVYGVVIRLEKPPCSYMATDATCMLGNPPKTYLSILVRWISHEPRG